MSFVMKARAVGVTRWLLRGGVALLLAGMAISVAAQPVYAPTARLDSGKVGVPTAADESFGSAIAVAGDIAVIGAFGTRAPQTYVGGAHVYQRDALGFWRFVQTLTAPGLLGGDRFGSAVAIDGDDILVGAPGDDTQATSAGAVHVFRRGAGGALSWTHVQKRLAADPRADREYGQKLGASAGRVVVGGMYDCGTGSVEVLARDGADWALAATLAPEAAHCQRFGTAVAIDGDRIAVSHAGGASIYQRTSGAWQHAANVKESMTYPWATDELALSGDLLAMSDWSYFDFFEDFGSGAAQLFEFEQGSWWLRKTFSPPQGVQLFEECGRGLAIRGNRFVLACGVAPLSVSGLPLGGLIAFDRADASSNAWTMRQSYPYANDAFNETQPLSTPPSSLAFGADDELLAGFGWDDGAAIDAGSVRVHRYRDGDPVPARHQTVRRVDAGEDDTFGSAVARFGSDWLFVGVSGDSAACELCGAVKVFHRTGSGPWSLTQTLLPEPPDDTQYFGGDVVAGDDFIAVGSSGARDDDGVRTGAVYIYQLVDGVWTRAARLLPAVTVARGRFGRAIAIDGGRLAIGAPPYLPPTPTKGSVYVFERGVDSTQWTESRRIIYGQTANSIGFGFSVALRGDVLVAGDGRRQATVFERNAGGSGNWGSVQDLPGFFGGAVGRRWLAIDDTRIVVSNGELVVPYIDASTDIFRRDGATWALSQRIIAPAMLGGDYLIGGISVELDGDRLVIGGATYDVPDNVLTATGVEVRTYEAAGNGRFAATGRFHRPFPRTLPSLPETAIVSDADAFYVGVPSEPGRDEPHPRDVGAVYVIERRSLPIFIDGFE